MVTGISGKSLGGERLRLRLGLSWAREVRQDAAGQRRGRGLVASKSAQLWAKGMTTVTWIVQLWLAG